MYGREQYLYILESISFPVINYRRTAYFGPSIVNFWAMAMGLFMMAAPMMGWINYESPSLSVAYWFAGLCEYIIGFYNWYMGRTMLSFIDFIYGLLFLVIYFTADLGKYQIYVPYYYHTYMQGIFYIIWFIILLVVILSLKDKGVIYSFNMFLLALACVFIIVWEFSKRVWARKIAGYILFLASICIWVAGLLRLLGYLFQYNAMPFVYPYW